MTAPPFARLAPSALLIAAALVCLQFAGCGDSAASGVTVAGDRRHSPLFLSELRTHPQPHELLDTSFEFRNATRDPAAIRFDGSGCSCYSVTTDGRKLTAGELLTIPPRSSVTVQLDFAPPQAVGEPRFYARFSWLPTDREPVELPISLTVPVLTEMLVTPNVLTFGYKPGVPPEPQPLTVACSAREREAVAQPPRLSDYPDYLQPGEWQAVERESPVDGFWRSVWQTELALNLPAGTRSELTTGVTLTSAAKGHSSSSERLTLLVQPRVGIRSPESVQFGRVTAEAPRKRRLLLIAADRLPFRVTGIATSDPRCQAATPNSESALQQWVEVEVNLADQALLDGHLTLTTDHPETSTLEIHVSALPAPTVDSPSTLPSPTGG